MANFIPLKFIEAVFARQVHYHPRERINAKKKDIIRRRLQEGYSVEDLINAIDGCHQTPFNCGKNDSGVKFLDLKTSLSQDNVCRFMELAESFAQASKLKELRRNTRENMLHENKGQPKVTKQELAEFRQWRKEIGI